MSAVRPDPDALLARVQREEAKAKRGKLKVFFGATAGVGKTYAMLEDARALKARGVDVVVGYVEPHGRAETEVLLEGLERLPYRQVAHRGAALRDFDLDAALLASRGPCSSTSWRTAIRSRASRGRRMPIAGRTSRSSSRRALPCIPRSTCSTSRA